jgi:hypothetical protein
LKRTSSAPIGLVAAAEGRLEDGAGTPYAHGASPLLVLAG